MARFLFDTNHLTHYEYGHPGVRARFQAEPPGEIALSIVTVEEYLRGRLATVAQWSAPGGPRLIAAYGRLETGCQLLRTFPFVGFDAAAEATVRRLRPIASKPGTRDLRIASIAWVHNLIVVTANASDFSSIPGLAWEDWTV